MAKAATPADAPAPAYELGKTYDVRLRKPCTVGAFKHLPLHDHTMTGKYLMKLIAENGADAVESADPI